MADVIDVANYILEISQEGFSDGECELISNMKLQKLVYFCQGYFLALYGRQLFPDPIEAWEHGPVCPKLYRLFKPYGSSPLTTSIDPQRIRLEDYEKRLIDMVYGSYGQYSASKLRNITHEKGPWNATAQNAVISHEIMLEYFESLVETNPAEIPLSTEREKDELVKILERAEANGEIDLSRFLRSNGSVNKFPGIQKSGYLSRN